LISASYCCERCADTADTLQDEKADVILKYMADEARNLKAYGELPENIRVNDADVFEEYEGDENDDIIEFDAIDDI
jgi:translation initiation factor 1A